MDLETLRFEIELKVGRPPLSHTREQLASLEHAIEDPVLREYLTSCLPHEIYEASGVRVLDRESIVDELAAAPAEYLFRFDFVPIARDVGGNAIVVHAWGDRGAKVWWADHTSFSEHQVSYKDRSTGQWVYLDGLNIANVTKALIPLDPDLEHFLHALLRDELDEQLDALDG